MGFLQGFAFLACADQPGQRVAPAAPPGPDGGAVPAASCVDATVSWELDDARLGYIDRSSVSPCRHYRRVRSFRDGSPELACEAELPGPGKGNMYNISDLRGALAQPDVAAALQQAPVHFAGADDKLIFRLKAGDKLVQLGGAGSQRQPPPGLGPALEFFRSLDTVFENNNPNCKLVGQRK
jgi:hypothetical protein